MEPSSTADQPTSLFDRINLWLRTSTMLKIIVIGFLVLVLLIPTSMLQSLIYERESTRNEAIKEVSNKWGSEQTVGGPILTVPYTAEFKDEKGKVEYLIRYAHFFPETLQINGKVLPEKRNRGIFVVMLYNTQLKISGSFKKPVVDGLGLSPAVMQWDKAFLSLGITDMKGIKDTIGLQVNEKTLVVNPGIPTSDIMESGVSAPIDLTTDRYSFDCTLNLNGSTQLSFLPFGKETTIRLQSPWASPSFTGAFLPDQRDITKDGFQASWKVLQYNRNYPQQGLGSFLVRGNENGMQQSAFGVKLLLPVDEYQKTMRSAKYAVMFIVITFAAFFFVEILDRRRIHPIQYLLVGFAICLFYLLLLSISEHTSFDWAYLSGGITILALITSYVRYIFKNIRLTALFSAILALLYGFFYSLLQLEDYSLLLGSFGLLLILSVIMYLTRHIDWYRAYESKKQVNSLS